MGSKTKALLFALFACIGILSIQATQNDNKEMPYPEGFRNWTLVTSSMMATDDAEDTGKNLYLFTYANETALAGYREGRFPNGSIIVFDKRLVDTTQSKFLKGIINIHPGVREAINVMYKDTEAFKDTGGWRFEEFIGYSKTDGRLTVQGQTNCFNSCHASQAKTDFVFSRFAE